MKLGSAGLLSMLSRPSARGESRADSAAESGAIEVRVTAGEKRFAQAPTLAWRPAGEASAETIAVEPGTGFQEILGFGAALTDAACYMLSQLPPDAEEHLVHELFHPSEMGLNVFRVCMGSSDYARKVYSFDEGAEPDPEMSRFSIDHDREYILPTLTRARRANPNLFLL